MTTHDYEHAMALRGDDYSHNEPAPYEYQGLDDLPAPDWHEHTDGDVCGICGAPLGWGSAVTA